MKIAKLEIKHLLFFGVFLFALFGFAQAANAATYYVAKTGSDSNSCNQAQSANTSKLTISSAFACLGTGNGAGAGHTVRVYAGTYTEVLNNNMPGGSSESQRFTFEGNPGDTVIIKPNVNYHIIRLANPTTHKYITMRNFVIDGADAQAGPEEPDGIEIVDQSIHHITLENLEIKNVSSQGVLMEGSYHLLTRLNVHDNGNDCFNVDQTYCMGLYLRVDNTVVEHSSLHGNTGTGGKFYREKPGVDPVNNILRYNLIYNNGSNGFLNAGTGSMYNNLVYNNGANGLWSFSGAIYNNTIYGTYVQGNYLGYCIEVDWGAPIIRNNVCYGNTTNSIFVDHGGSSINADHNLFINPQFVNVSSNDFHLQPTSPAINAGTTLTEVATDFDGVLRPQGSGYDIGAYEYVSGGTPTPTPGLSGDLNSDSRVNSVDAAILMGAWGQTTKPKADINQDGIVNSVDASLMMGQWTS